MSVRLHKTNYITTIYFQLMFSYYLSTRSAKMNRIWLAYSPKHVHILLILFSQTNWSIQSEFLIK